MLEKMIFLSNAIRMNVYDSKENKPAILFLHFSGGTNRMWDGVIPLFEKEYRVVAPDLRGHGKTDKPLTGYHIDELAEDLNLLIQELGIQKCHIIGSSLGAEVGLSLASSHPDVVLSLVCEGAFYNEFGEFGLYNGSDAEIEEKMQKMKAQLEERKVPIFDTAEEFMKDAQARFEKHSLWNQHFKAFATSTMVQIEDGRYASHYSNHVNNEYMEIYWNLKFETYYEKVQCPILFLPSKWDVKNEKINNSIKAFSKLIDIYEIVHLENSIHGLVWMQMPLIAGETVISFIRKYFKGSRKHFRS